MAPSFERSDVEAALINELRCSMGSELRKVHDDFALLQWLKVNDMSVEQAGCALKKSIEYINQMDMDNYLPNGVLEKYYPGGFCGLDKDGSPVKIEQIGSLDMKGIMRSCTRQDMEKFKIYQLEKMTVNMLEMSEKVGVRIHGMTTILDMEGVGSEWLWRPGMQLYFNMVNLIDEHYPGTTKRIFIIHAPGIFPLLWKIGKSFMSPKIQSSIEIMGSNYQEKLLEYLPAEQLPVYLGGTLTDQDGNTRCLTLLNTGGKVPPTCYTPLTGELIGMKVKDIASGQKFCLNYDVLQAGIIISWSFRTDDNDIAFGIDLKFADDTEEILMKKRVQSHHIIEDGSITCQKAGTYEVCFDNSFSWATPKKLYYTVECHMVDEKTMLEVDCLVPNADWEAIAGRRKSWNVIADADME